MGNFAGGMAQGINAMGGPSALGGLVQDLRQKRQTNQLEQAVAQQAPFGSPTGSSLNALTQQQLQPKDLPGLGAWWLFGGR